MLNKRDSKSTSKKILYQIYTAYNTVARHSWDTLIHIWADDIQFEYKVVVLICNENRIGAVNDTILDHPTMFIQCNSTDKLSEGQIDV